MKGIKTIKALALALFMLQAFSVTAMDTQNNTTSVGLKSEEFIGWFTLLIKKIQENETIKSITESKIIKSAIKDFEENETVQQIVKKIQDNPRTAKVVGAVALTVIGYYTLKASYRAIKNTVLCIGGGTVLAVGGYFFYKEFIEEGTA